MSELVSRRRFWRFSLRTLLLAMTLAAVAIGWVASNLAHVWDREAILMRQRGPSVTHLRIISRRDLSKLPWMWRMLGAEPVDALAYDPQRTRPEDIERLKRLFPEAVLMPLEPLRDAVGAWDTPQSGRPTVPRLSKKLGEL
jgi:hypothetical protein